MMQLPPGTFRPGYSLLHELDAAVKIICLLLLLLAEAFADGLIGHGVMTGLTLAVVYLSQLERSEAFAPVKKIWGLLVFIFTVDLLFFPADFVWYRWWIFAPSPEGLNHAVKAVLRACVLVLLCSSLATTTSPIKLCYGLEKILRPLTRIGFPSAAFAQLVSTTFQFVPILFDEAEKLRLAQSARGARFESRSFLDRATAMLPLLLPLTMAAFRRAAEVSKLMESRTAGDAPCRSELRWEKPTLQDASALLVSFAALALQLLVI